jgi:Predicted transcriptional regulators
MDKARILADGIEVWCAYDKLVKVEELLPNPKNPNTHPTNQIKLLAQNIQYHGWRHGIVVSKLSGFIVAGHGRLDAAKELGVAIVPVEYQDFASEDNELAVLVGDNRLAELSTLDLNSLSDIIDQFKESDFDTVLAGFDENDLNALLNGEQDDEFKDEDEKELSQSNVTIQAGNYRFRMTQEEFGAWMDKLKQDVGFDKESVIEELKKRLAI